VEVNVNVAALLRVPVPVLVVVQVVVVVMQVLVVVCGLVVLSHISKKRLGFRKSNLRGTRASLPIDQSWGACNS